MHTNQIAIICALFCSIHLVKCYVQLCEMKHPKSFPGITIPYRDMTDSAEILVIFINPSNIIMQFFPMFFKVIFDRKMELHYFKLNRFCSFKIHITSK
jgi:hypothetical protein